MPTPGPGASPPWTARRVRASGSSVLLAIGAIVVVALARDLFVAAVQPIGWLAAATALAVVIFPLVELLDRWVPRGVAIVAILLVGVVGLGSLGAGLVVEVQDQLGELRVALPRAAEELEASGGEDSPLGRLQLGSLTEDLVDRTSERLSPKPTIEDAVGTVPAYLVSGILVIFLLVWGGSILAGLQRQIADPERRDLVSRVAGRATHLAQRYVIGSLALALVVTPVGAGLAWAAGLPAPLTIGVLLGVAATIPSMGIVAAGVPVLVLSAASRPFATTLALAAAIVALQAGTSLVTRRVLEARTLHVGPSVMVVAALVGTDLYGIGGGLVAVIAGVFAVAGIEAWDREQAVDGPTEPVGPDPAPA